MKDYKEAIESIMKDTTSKVMDHAIKAYRQGYENGLGKAQTDSYVKGYEDGKAATPFTDTEEAEKKAYEDGMNVAWEVARKLVHPRLGGYTEEQKQRIFGEYVSSDSILQNFTASEALAKIKEYEDKQKQDDWRDIPSDEMTLDQARRAVKELRAEALARLRGAE